jgi:pimeloyl-ACP methyl ester carboxylesterase
MSHTIVLVHGAFAESASWDGVLEPLAADGPSRSRGRSPS